MAPDNANERIRDYDRLAKLHDHRLGLYTRRAIDDAIELARLRGDEAILDLCCGPGELLQLLGLRSHKGKIIGLDFSDSMLNVASRRVRPYANIEIKKAPAHSLPYSDAEFDLVFNTNAFHYLEEPEQVLREVLRVLRPHGRLIIVDLAANSHLTRLWLLIRRLFRPAYHRAYRLEDMLHLLKQAGFVSTRRKLIHINLLWSVMVVEAHKPAPPQSARKG